MRTVRLSVRCSVFASTRGRRLGPPPRGARCPAPSDSAVVPGLPLIVFTLRGARSASDQRHGSRRPAQHDSVTGGAARDRGVGVAGDLALHARARERLREQRPGAAGIPESWLVDLVGRRIERYTEPRPGGYRLVLIARSGEAIPSTMIPGLTFAVDEVIR